VYGTLSVVLVGLGIAKIDEPALSQTLPHRAVKTPHDCSASVVTSTYHLTECLRVEVRYERSRVHEVTGQHRQMAVFGPRGSIPHFRRSLLWRDSCGLR
jgi:hypothetical protein